MGNTFTLSCDQTLSKFQNCIYGQAAYVFNLEDNLDALRTALQKLIEARDDVMTRVKIAERQQMSRLREVEGWLLRVEADKGEVDKLLAESTQEIGKLCLGGYCSKNCKSSYKFGKKVSEKLELLATLKKEGVFEQVAERIPEDPADEIPFDQSAVVGHQSVFDEVWRCLAETQVTIICLYGKGGVGKTTLLKKINSELRHDHERGGFFAVIWVVVSKEPKLEKIQEEILKKISFGAESWKNKNFEDRAKIICNILSQKRFALLMDDIWEPIDLTKVGVPLRSSRVASKIIFTTRNLDICGHMNVDREFEVRCLSEEEAQELFQLKVGSDILESHTAICKAAETMVKECDGLPLALNTVAQAMAYRKTPEEWIHALQLLQRSVSEFPGMNREVYPQLKFSYDNLPDDKTRSCFLYCSLFPEDSKIYKSYLIDCWLSEGFLDGCGDSVKRNQGHSIIGILVRACLLEKDDDDDCVKMHDVIRDMASWVTRRIEMEDVTIQAGAGLVKAPMVEKWQGAKRMSLMKNKIEILSEVPVSPHLQTLFLNFNRLRMISDDFFQSMSSLRVLNLSYNDDLTKLPLGMSRLVSLRYLDLAGTAVKELPNELKALDRLQCLNLENTLYLRKIPKGLMSSFSRLRVLRMFGCLYLREGADDAKSFVEELICLQYLNVLSVTIAIFTALETFLSSPKLQSCTKSLCLQDLKNSSLLSISSFAEMKYLVALHVLDCTNCFDVVSINYRENLQCLREYQGFHSLREVRIEHCDKLPDLTWLILAPNLKHVQVSYCSLREIINKEKFVRTATSIVDLNPLSKLESLQLYHLVHLTSFYPDALSFPSLREMRIVDCAHLQTLPLDSGSANPRELIITGDKFWWEKLQWEDQATKHVFLPCFKSL